MNKKAEPPKKKKQEKFFPLVVDDIIYQTRFNKMQEKRTSYVPSNPNHLKAFMPGNIPEVFVKENDLVREGDKLMILEAMKMKNLILAPFDAKIIRINAQKGDKVKKNFILIELEETEILEEKTENNN
ncbi:MAG: biotin/lipoyl-containing protein [Bacteroidota bacterium]